MAPIGKPTRIVRRPIPTVNPATAPGIPAGPIFVPKEQPIEVPEWPVKKPVEVPAEQ